MPQAPEKLTIKLDSTPSDKNITTIYDGLKHYNLTEFKDLAEHDVACFAVNRQGEIMAGVTGQYRGKTLQINYFWVSPARRNSGLGTTIFNHLENDAKDKKIHAICLDTYSSQAPGFYQKLGFSEVGRYQDYIKPGIDKIFMRKLLAL